MPAYREMFVNWLHNIDDDPHIFPLEEIRYWAMRLFPKDYEKHLQTLRPWSKYYWDVFSSSETPFPFYYSTSVYGTNNF